MVRGSIVRDDEIGPSIGVEIARQNPEARPAGGIQSQSRRDVLEFPVALVMEDLGDGPLERLGSAIIAPARGREARACVEIDVMHHHQIEEPVFVVIDERRAGGPA